MTKLVSIGNLITYAFVNAGVIALRFRGGAEIYHNEYLLKNLHGCTL